MVAMTRHSTYAPGAQTTQSIKRLAQPRGVSQAEGIRRSIRLASEQGTVLTPAEVVAHYASRPPVRSAAQTQRLIKSTRALRYSDDARRARK